MEACKRVVQLGIIIKHNHHNHRHMSQLVQSNRRPPSIVDTTALVRRLEAQGVPTKQAEAVTGAIIQVSSSNNTIDNNNNNNNNNNAYFILENNNNNNDHHHHHNHNKIDMLQEFKFDSTFRAQLQSFQVHRLSMLQNESEKQLRHEMENFCSELRYETDKVIAGQRLDVNLEKGRIREELVSQVAETAKLTIKLEKDIHALRAKLEAAKYDVIKYGILTLPSMCAFGLAVIYFLK